MRARLTGKKSFDRVKTGKKKNRTELDLFVE